MRKKLLALLLTLALVTGLCPSVLAAGTLKASEATTEVEKKLAALQTKDGYRPGDKPSFADECMPFAKQVFKQLFGYDTNSLYYNGRLVANANLVRVGRYFVPRSGCSCNVDTKSGVDSTSITADNVKTLLSKAKCGDILQVLRFHANPIGCSVARPHTMIVQQVKSDSIVVYEGNYKKDTVGVREITFKNFASTYDHVITIYRANNYDKVNGGNSDTTTTVDDNGPVISPTTEPGQNLPQGKPFYFKGKITSVSKVTSATISILSPDGKTTYQTKTIKPNTLTVDIATSGLDALKFGQLSPGSYLFHLTASNQSGKTSSWQKGFSIAGAAPVTPAPAPQEKPSIVEAGIGSYDVNLLEKIQQDF